MKPHNFTFNKGDQLFLVSKVDKEIIPAQYIEKSGNTHKVHHTLIDTVAQPRLYKTIHIVNTRRYNLVPAALWIHNDNDYRVIEPKTYSYPWGI